MPSRLIVPVSEGVREPGAYVKYRDELLCVEFFEVTGPGSGRLHCLNCRDERPVGLSDVESRQAVLVRGPADEG